MYPIAPVYNPVDLWKLPATVQCGFPSPAEDHQQERLDLLKLIIKQPDATFFMRVRGSSMREVGIDDGDLVVIDRSIDAKHGHIVLAVVDDDFTIKRLYQKNGITRLLSANTTFPHIDLKEGQELRVWGIVTWTLKKLTNA